MTYLTPLTRSFAKLIHDLSHKGSGESIPYFTDLFFDKEFISSNGKETSPLVGEVARRAGEGAHNQWNHR
jgi:hypothetical protein